MVGLPFTDADGVATTLRLRDVETVLRSKRTAMRPVLQREGCPEFGEEAALAFHVYTLERPFRIYAIVNGQLHSSDRSAGPRARCVYRRLLSAW